ncbi:pilus assembly protein PilN (plasmid) [Robbsia andropogonis]|uniref:pilus assembly protein PilN n=1 Tax=Robbsia andropogonis TaxID=28092 RepID=UPI003D25C521
MKNNLTRIASTLTIAATLTSLGGCEAFDSYHRADALSKETRDKLNAPAPVQPTVAVHEGDWLLGEKIRASKPQPKIFDKAVVFNPGSRAAAMSLSDLATWIAQNVGVPTNIDVSVDSPATADSAAAAAGASAAKVTMPGTSMRSPILPGGMGAGAVATLERDKTHSAMAFKGTLKEFLNVVDARYDVWSRYENGTITFYKTETRSFSIALMKGTSTFAGTISTKGSSSGGSSSGSSSSSSSTSSEGKQTMDQTTTLEPWKNLAVTAKAVAGPGANVVADADLSTLTVTGTPPQCERVAAFVRDLNANWGKQIALEVHLYQITRTTEDNYGATLSLQYKNASGANAFTLSSISAPTVSSSYSAMSFGATITGGRLSGSTAAIQALSTLGHMSEVISRAGITQNGKVLGLQSAVEEGYVQSTSTTTTTNAGSTTSIQTSTLVPGFTSTFLPKMVDGKILLDFDITLSNLNSLTTYTTNSTSVQLPTMSMTRLTQSVLLKPGQTLILTGMNKQKTTTTNNGTGSAFLPIFGGGLDAAKDDAMIAVVITARLM